MKKFIDVFKHQRNRALKELEQYIKEEVGKGKRDFDIGVDSDMNIMPESLSRIRFTVESNEPRHN